MRMRGKYRIFKPEELEAWENDLEKTYPTTEEIEKEIVAFPVKHRPVMEDVRGLDTMFMRKPKQTTRPFTEPEEIARRMNANRLEKESDRKLFADHMKDFNRE